MRDAKTTTTVAQENETQQTTLLHYDTEKKEWPSRKEAPCATDHHPKLTYALRTSYGNYVTHTYTHVTVHKRQSVVVVCMKE